MFESLRRAFREAVDNFHAELRRDEVPEAADRLLRAMKREAERARADLARLEEEAANTRSRAEREEEEARTCLRRERLAAGVGDRETVEVARGFARRHVARSRLLSEKADILERELRDRRLELDEMMQRLRDASVRREALSASAGRTDARRRLDEADRLFEELDRMSGRVDDLEHRAEAAQELDQAMARGNTEPDGGAPQRNEELDVERALAELKRRMDLAGGPGPG